MLPEEDKEKIEAALMRMESREVARRTKEREGDALKEWKKVEEKKREGGKKEFYLKKCELAVLRWRRGESMLIFRGFAISSGPKGGVAQSQVRHAVQGQEAAAQGGREEEEEDGPVGQEAHAGEASRRRLSAMQSRRLSSRVTPPREGRAATEQD